ncbi:unnamed protein product [Danaus chrysippus]|uniref:(African queen) hypothetical protein n=1 Tax=Danaus chrysippus TaxID=151541 RepID=A0A8J2W955_9NEOP|nr:unnamed protein product [Danaus chrysippus]
MIGTYIVLLVVGACTAIPEPNGALRPAPPYVQANEQFTQAKYLVQSNLPLQPRDIHDPAQRQNLGFGVLTGVVSDLVDAVDKDEDNLLVLAKSVPASLRNYLKIATEAQLEVSDLDLKVQLVTDYMALVCSSNSVSDCNKLVQDKVNEEPVLFGPAAKLLLNLGKVSQVILNNQDTVEEVTKDHGEVSYLLHNVDTPEFKAFIRELANLKHEAKGVQFRSAVSAEKDEDTFIPNFISLYFESNQSITIAKQHVMNHLSPEKSDVASYAIILGVIGRLAQDYIVDSKNFDPFSSLYDHIEYAVRNYNTTLNEFKDIILEVTRKIELVVI